MCTYIYLFLLMLLDPTSNLLHMLYQMLNIIQTLIPNMSLNSMMMFILHIQIEFTIQHSLTSQYILPYFYLYYNVSRGLVGDG